MMTNVEHIHGGTHWAEPLRSGGELQVKQVGNALQITGLFPLYEGKDHPADVLHQYEMARRNRRSRSTGKDSPHIVFANADTDQKLLAFVRRFGPVVAESAEIRPAGSLPSGWLPGKTALGNNDRLVITATQDMEELRNEQLIYRCALALVMELGRAEFNNVSAKFLIKEIASHIGEWPRQWERQRSQCTEQPLWQLTADALKRIQGLSSDWPDPFLPPIVDSRIVICELVNVFRAIAFPNPMEMHASIRYGIRPLLYAILRREFFHPYDVSVCANNLCRQYFEIERAGQQFCSAECSLRKRQREYWSKRGKKLRKKRLKSKKKRQLTV